MSYNAKTFELSPCDIIGASDITPGMLAKLRKHELEQYAQERVIVRERKSGKVVEVIDPLPDGEV